MMNIICDACKKTVPNAARERNYFTILNRAVCVSCKERLEDILRKEMFKKSTYTYEMYQNLYKSKLNEICR